MDLMILIEITINQLLGLFIDISLVSGLKWSRLCCRIKRQTYLPTAPDKFSWKFVNMSSNRHDNNNDSMTNMNSNKNNKNNKRE